MGGTGGTLGTAGRQLGTGISLLPSLEQGDTRPATPWGPEARDPRPAGQQGGGGRRVVRPG